MSGTFSRQFKVYEDMSDSLEYHKIMYCIALHVSIILNYITCILDSKINSGFVRNPQQNFKICTEKTL